MIVIAVIVSMFRIVFHSCSNLADFGFDSQRAFSQN
jgi:hypothetical protein